MSARTVYMVWGGPTTPDKADEVDRWYAPHLIEMCTLPGLISAQLFKPSSVQLPRLVNEPPGTMAIYEFDTDDLAGAFKTLWASSITRRILPPAEGVFTLHPDFQSAVYDLDDEYPKGPKHERDADGLPPRPPVRKEIMMVFGASEGDAWWAPHLTEISSSPGLTACRVYRPSDVQLPRLTTELPRTMALCEFDTNDLARDVDALWSTHMDDAFVIDPVYETVIYELDSQWPPPAGR
jgi:hypothetical protein